MSPMSSPAVALLFSLFLLSLSAADAFNITQILNTFPDFTTFNNYLIIAGVADEINSKQTITVLVVANGNMSAVSGQSADAIKKALSVHVILDYYDEAKLKNLATKTTLTTLYQQSGKAQNQEGFLNVTHVGSGPITFGSAAPGSNVDSVLLKTISTEPYNISVLQISNIINVGSNSTTPSSPPAQEPAVSPLHPPAASPPRKALAPASSSTNPSNATAPSADTPTGSNSSQAPAVSPPHPPAASPPRNALAPAPNHIESPAASPPNQSNAIAPSADTPTGSLSNPVADGPGSDDKASAVSVTCGNYLASILMVFTSAWLLLTLI